MEFAIHPPPHALAGTVKAIWMARGSQQEFDSPEPIAPDGCVEMVLNLGDAFIDAGTGERQPKDLLTGQMTRPVAIATGDVDLIGIRFHTGRGGAAFRLPMWELQDRLLAASDVFKGSDRLVDDLRSVGRADRLDHLSTALARRLDRSAVKSNRAVDEALMLHEASNGRMPIERLADRIGITRRHLERLFRDDVGLGAKQLARIKRVHFALEMAHRDAAMSGAEIAAACGYSDQSHLIRECRHIAGRTPHRLTTTARSLAGLMRATA